MKNKKISIMLSILTAGAIALSGCGASESDNSAKGGEAPKEYEQVTFAYATMNNIPTEEGLSSVEEAVNEITREKIGVEVTLKPIAIADYSQSVSRSLQGGEKIDVFQAIYDFSNCVSTGMGYNLTELVPEYAKEAEECIGEEWLKACTVDGNLYGLPVYKNNASHGYFLCRADIVDDLGIDLSGITSTSDLTEVFAQVQEAYPDMTMLAPLSAGMLAETYTWSEIDYLSDSDNGAWGVLIGDDTTVKDLYSSDLFINSVNLAREWYESGYIMKDAATTASSVSELIATGNYFGWFTRHALPADELASQMSIMNGQPLKAVEIGDSYICTSNVNMVTMMVASNTKVPEASVKFLNLLYSDADVINTIIFGIEGRDYVLTEDGYAAYPEGQDANTVPYTNQMDNGILGNGFIMYPVVGSSKESIEYGIQANKEAPISPAMGFIFDSSSVASQYTAVINVTNQYLPGLLCGSVDPVTELPKFTKALDDAGYQTIMEEKQKQLDAWLAAN